MARIYTRSGDAGETGLADGTRIGKHQNLVEAIGDIDELNAHVGLIRADQPQADIDAQLAVIQHHLFDIGAQVAQFKDNPIKQRQVQQLEQWIDAFQAELTPIKQFILPAGNRIGSHVHLARSICRRAERHVWLAAEKHDIEIEVLHYLNRLSDYLFVLARALNKKQEVFWQQNQ
ncbi:cob(I)yrinic acid a,c-diamide adenosyltransferase [Marinicella gelatinilytica]|uniref:cob(I)yrinic acid a,c-diamide adenosyltransferase n=1 Tax=Marinicella gelatinilytica TaxID=2996017 RepID=UPI002260C9FB|nr:cob(I)yrinic acid a,c-diamide adenosyltransferase [Marinicella gelatinilytica]MCX7543996.1 cob(I)yrinic acid a,c-diamide adenosyltransferase [Marinicella gelatinilytica]